MQILYGELLGDGTLRYLQADNASLNMTNVVSVHIGLLVATKERVASGDDTRTYTLAGTKVEPVGSSGATATHAKDRRMRRVFSTTIRLRNRG